MTESNKEELFCIGCGAQLQSENENKEGYVPSSVLNKDADEVEEVYCKRCFRLRHYNEVSDIELTDDDFLTMLNEISSKDALIVNLVDIFDLNGTMVSGMQRFAGNNPLIIVGNKMDLVPNVISQGKIRQWLTEQVHALGLRPKEVEIVSALRPNSVKKIMELINKERKGRDVYIVGTTNVGKSTFINQIINIATESENIITSSYFPGTTLGMIEIPLDDGNYIIDTPGIIQKNNLSHFLSGKELKKIIPKKEVKPKVYQLEEKQTIFIEGLARFDYIEGDGIQPFVFYTSNDLKLHRTKLENADDLYDRHLGDLLSPPFIDSVNEFPKLKEHQLTIKEARDIVISGLGWISIHQAPAKISIWAPEGVDIYQRKVMI